MSEDIKKNVRSRYGQLARSTPGASCCDDAGSCCGHYADEDLEGLPPGLARMSLGSGNPISMADLSPGETVLDLGSGAGLDVFLAARRVGETGKVYGLDMTDEMLALAEKHKVESGISNVEFIKGDMEQVPLADGTVDTVVSNCVVNLSPDKARVFSECYRVLKPGGKIAISDPVWEGPVPPGVRNDADLWCSCVGGALTEEEYEDLLVQTGFTDVRLQQTGAWPMPDVNCCTTGSASVNSAFITARKPS